MCRDTWGKGDNVVPKILHTSSLSHVSDDVQINRGTDTLPLNL